MQSIYRSVNRRKNKPKPKCKPVSIKEGPSYLVSEKVASHRKIYSERLKKTHTKSEVWFFDLYKSYQDIDDVYNEPLGNYIPDMANHKYKYVVEIDGSIHDRPDIKEKDLKKDKYYKALGYRVMRIQAYDIQKFNKVNYILNIIKKKIIKKNISFNTQIEIDTYLCT